MRPACLNNAHLRFIGQVLAFLTDIFVCFRNAITVLKIRDS